MFEPISLPYGAKMLFNTVKLKPGVEFEDVELAVGEMCNVVKNTYGGDKGGFLAGQVFKFTGFVSDAGSLTDLKAADDHIAIFRARFAALAEMCSESKELGYDMLWQGTAGD
jgi:hypothetical protein